MDRLRTGRRWAREFIAGDYQGPPVDYIMALAIVVTMMVVTIVG